MVIFVVKPGIPFSAFANFNLNDMKKVQIIPTVLISILIIALYACSKSNVDDVTAANGDPTGAMYVVNIQGMRFQPDTLFALPGYTVTWKNLDGVAHSVVSDDGTSFNSGLINPGGTYKYVTVNNQIYPYHCGIHPGEKAVLSVVIR